MRQANCHIALTLFALLLANTVLAQEDGEPSKKFLVFTEFTATQEMLTAFLEGRGYSAVTLNGGMDIVERRAALEAFRQEAQVLISTDAGGEGLKGVHASLRGL